MNPVFIIGVPRSGTTLLRLILDSHSKIAAASETPWILGTYVESSVRQLTSFLIDCEYGPVKNIPGVTPQSLLIAMRAFIEKVFTPYLTLKKKDLLVLKTPDDIKHIDFLLKLYPESKYIHIVRDGRDSACSMVENSSSLFANELDGYGVLNHLNAMKRWYEWEIKVRSAFSENRINPVEIRYEDMVRNPTETVSGICRGIGVEFEPEMLSYQQYEHELPEWEAGTYDVKRRKINIDTTSIGRWSAKFTLDEKNKVSEMYSTFLHDLGYE